MPPGTDVSGVESEPVGAFVLVNLATSAAGAAGLFSTVARTKPQARRAAGVLSWADSLAPKASAPKRIMSAMKSDGTGSEAPHTGTILFLPPFHVCTPISPSHAASTAPMSGVQLCLEPLSLGTLTARGH